MVKLMSLVDARPAVRLTSVEFENFKALQEFKRDLGPVNVLVGPNNCGKSTIISAYRALDVGIRKATAKSAVVVEGPHGKTLGHVLSAETLPLSVENVHTDYKGNDSRITFRFSNANSLTIWFPQERATLFIPMAQGRQIKSPSDFKREFPFVLGVVPVLGPVEHREELLTDDYVRRFVGTHRASRHFRNYWRLYPEGFDDFANLVAQTWPSMAVERPEVIMGRPPVLAMFSREAGIPRELYWSGFGFQIWCQLLTHITRSRNATGLVIDEPEVYLHPDVQRQLMGILRDVGPSVLIATHSSEIIADADVHEIIEVDKAKKKGRRLRDVAEVQVVLEAMGSVHNVTLTKIARNRRVLFVEDDDDYKRLRRFAKRLGLVTFSQGVGVSPVQSGGFSSWPQVKHMAGLLERTLGAKLNIAAVYDRDYWCSEEIVDASDELARVIALAHFHQRKELENYMLVPAVLNMVVSELSGSAIDLGSVLHELTEPRKADWLGQYLAKRSDYLRRTKKDTATANAETYAWFENKWATIDGRMELACGKEVLAGLRAHCKAKWNISLTDARLIDGIHRDSIPFDLSDLLRKLENFARS